MNAPTEDELKHIENQLRQVEHDLASSLRYLIHIQAHLACLRTKTETPA